MANLTDLDLSVVCSYKFSRVLLIYQHDASKKKTRHAWALLSEDANTKQFTLLDEVSCNRALNHMDTIRAPFIRFMKEINALPLVMRAKKHLTIFVDALTKLFFANEEVPTDVSDLKIRIRRADPPTSFDVADTACLIMRYAKKGETAGIVPLINQFRTGTMWFADAFYELRSQVTKMSVGRLIGGTDMQLCGYRSGCGIKYFSHVAKYYRRQTEDDAFAFYSGFKGEDNRSRVFEFIIGRCDNDWINNETEMGVIFGMSYKVRQDSPSKLNILSHDLKKSLTGLTSVSIRPSGVYISDLYGPGVSAPIAFYTKDAIDLLKLIDTPGTVVRIEAKYQCSVSFFINRKLCATIPVGMKMGTSTIRSPEATPSVVCYTRFNTARVEFILTRRPATIICTHKDKGANVLKCYELRQGCSMSNDVYASLNMPNNTAWKFFLDNDLSCGRSGMKELDCSMRLYRAARTMASGMFCSQLCERVVKPCEFGSSEFDENYLMSALRPTNVDKQDPYEPNSVILYDSVYPSHDKRRGYVDLLLKEDVLKSYLRDVSIIGRICLHSRVVHNDMHGRNVLWRKFAGGGAPLLSLIDMDRSEYLPASCDTQYLACGVTKDISTYLIECFFQACTEIIEQNKTPNEQCITIFSKVNSILSYSLKTTHVFTGITASSLNMIPCFDIMEEWCGESPNRHDWAKYYKSKRGYNFRVKPDYIKNLGLGQRDCYYMLSKIWDVSL